MSSRYLAFFSFIYLIGFLAKAEGTKQVRLKESDQASLAIEVLPDRGGNFSYFNGPESNRLNIHVCEVGETVYLGFDQNSNLQFRILDPDGVLVSSTTLTNPSANGMNSLNRATGPGIIANYAQAVQGPLPLAAGGYTPFSFIANKTGDYYVEFFAITYNPVLSQLALFDVTVQGLDGTRKNGRLWSKAWSFYTGDFSNAFEASLYIYTSDRIVTKVDMNGIKPAGFVVSSNDQGTDSTGNYLVNRQSVNGNKTFPLYKIFLNDPDSACYPSGVMGSLIGDPKVSGCPGNYCIEVNVTAAGSFQVGIELNGVPGIQTGSRDRLLSGNLSAGFNCIRWDGRDGQGNPVTNLTKISVDIRYLNGLTHLPIYDVEAHPKGYVVTYVRPKPAVADSLVGMFWDDGVINGEVNTVNGCKSTLGCHIWRPVVENTDNSIGNGRTLNTWWYVKQSVGNLSFAYNDRWIDANKNTPGKGKANDTIVCAHAKEVGLHGAVGGESHVRWTTIFGTGKLGNDTLLGTTYFPSKSDSLQTRITLLLSSVGSACPGLQDTMTIWLEPMPYLALSGPASICSNNPTINLSAQFQNALGLRWQGKSGLFRPDSLSTTLSYVPSAEEIVGDTVKLKATTRPRANALCPNRSDSLRVIVRQGAKVSLPPDTTICQTLQQPLVLKATLLGQADSLVWRSTGPTPSPKRGTQTSFAITQSTPFQVITTAYRAGCLPESDTLQLAFHRPPSFQLAAADICPNATGQLRTTLDDPNLAGQVNTFTWKRNGVLVPTTDWRQLSYKEPGLYELQLSIQQCQSQQSKRVALRPVPVIDMPTSYVYCDESNQALTIQAGTFATYAWYLEGELISDRSSIQVKPDKKAYYQVQVTNAEGCANSAIAEVKVACPPRLFVPNVITPDKNDQNAVLTIFGKYYTHFEFFIFNRWGEVIFHTTDPALAWDGTYKNSPMPIGTYPWMVTYEGEVEEYRGPYKKTGEVTVVR